MEAQIKADRTFINVRNFKLKFLFKLSKIKIITIK